jgi:hypothetical protein
MRIQIRHNALYMQLPVLYILFLSRNRNGVFSGKTAQAIGVLLIGAQGFQEPFHGDKRQSIGTQGFAELGNTVAVADQVLAVRGVDAEITGKPYRGRTDPDVDLLGPGVP